MCLIINYLLVTWFVGLFEEGAEPMARMVHVRLKGGGHGLRTTCMSMTIQFPERESKRERLLSRFEEVKRESKRNVSFVSLSCHLEK